MKEDFFPLGLAWKHSGNEQGLNCLQHARSILQGWWCAYSSENPWGCSPPILAGNKPASSTGQLLQSPCCGTNIYKIERTPKLLESHSYIPVIFVYSNL